MSDFSQDFLDNGFFDLGSIIDKKKCQDLLKQIQETRSFGSELFIDEEEHIKNPRWIKNNPGPGINLAEKYDLDFIEKNELVQNVLTKVLGPGYKIKLKKFVVSVPEYWLPEWINKETKEQMIANLGAYIKPEHKDLTYFRGIDFHQDTVGGEAGLKLPNFITLYVYLDDVEIGMSPLVVIPKSHIFGATKFPHDIKINWDSDKCSYSDRKGNKTELNYKFLTGKTGQTYFWSALTLHGTQPNIIKKSRISLRYLIERSSNEGVFLIDKVYKKNSPLMIDTTRNDVDESGKPIKFGKVLKSN